MPSDDQLPSHAHRNDYSGDRSLVVQMLAGDPSAWQDFIRCYSRLIRSRVADVANSFGMGEDLASIDDATADVFSSLIANDIAALRAYAGRSSLTTYLAVIATRCATRRFVRSRQRQRKQITTEWNQWIDSGIHTDPEAKVLRIEEREEIHRRLAELPPKQREVIRLFHLEGKSYAAISHELEIPLGSVGVTLRRAEAKLREGLEPPP